MRCPQCTALAADSDPYCLWCNTRLHHSRSAPAPPRRGRPSYGWPDGNARSYDGAGMALGMAGMFVGSAVAAGAGPDLVKSAIAGAVCCGLPFLLVLLTVRLLGRSR